MPVIKKEQITAGDLAGNSARVFANKDLGSASLTVTEITVEPGGEIRLHTHPGHEECMVILSGDLQATMGDVVESVSAGDTVIAPADTVHGLKNISGDMAKFLAIFPTTDIQRHWVE